MALGWVRDYLRRRQRLGAFARHVSPSDLRSLLLGALDYANGRLYEQSGSHDDFVAGGTSLTAVLIAPKKPSAPHTRAIVPVTPTSMRFAPNASSCALP